MIDLATVVLKRLGERAIGRSELIVNGKRLAIGQGDSLCYLFHISEDNAKRLLAIAQTQAVAKGLTVPLKYCMPMATSRIREHYEAKRRGLCVPSEQPPIKFDHAERISDEGPAPE